MSRRQQLKLRGLLIVTALAVVILPFGVTLADSCTGDCEGENCAGGCTISHPTCGVLCLDDSCPGRAVCKTFGETPAGLNCTTEGTSNCSQSGQTLPPKPDEQPSGLRIASSADWAVLSYTTNFVEPLPLDEVNVLATSDPSFARVSRDELVTRNRADASRLRQRIRDEDLQVADTPQTRLQYAVSPAGPSIGVRLEVDQQYMPDAQEGSLFLRATVDAKGMIVAAEVLHSLAQGAEERMVQFVKENTRLWRKDGKSEPFEVYIAFSTMEDGSAGWIVAGAKALL